MSNKNSDYYFLRGGGEMGKLIRAKDWSKTALGDPADWPQSLCTMVAVILGNPFAMYIAWGSEHTQLYNDAYRLILGATKHPQALGSSTQDSFPEIWHIIESIFIGAMNGKAVGFSDFMVSLNRNGFLEECYFDFSYTPIRNNDGSVGGVLVTVVETTNKKKAEESLKESNQRFRNIVQQAPVAMCIFRGDNYIVEIANDRTLGVLIKDKNFIGKPFFESMPELENQIKPIFDNIIQSGIPFYGNEFEVTLFRNGKNEKAYFNFVYEPIREEDKTISGIIVAATEVTDQINARKKIEEGEAFSRSVMESSPDCLKVIDAEGQLQFMNVNGLCTMEIDDFSVFKNKPWSELWGEENKQLANDAIDKALTGNTASFEAFCPTAKGTPKWWDITVAPVISPQSNKINSLISVSRDITEQVNARKIIKDSQKQLQTVLRQAPAAIAVLEGPTHTYALANSAYQKINSRSEEQMLGKTAREVFPELEGTGAFEILDNVFNTGQTFSMAEYPLMVDINNDGIVQQQYFNFTAAPIKAEGKVVSVMVMVFNITEQVVARKKIEESEQRFQAAIQAVKGILWTNNAKGEMEGEQPAWASLTGQTHEEYQGYGWAKVVHPDDVQPTVDAWNEAVQERKTFIFEHRVKTKDGQWRYFSIRAIPLINADGTLRQWVGVHTDITEQKTFAEQLEKQVEERTAELKASEEKFYTLFNLSPVCKTLADATTGKIVMVNDAFTDVFGYSREETLNKSGAELGMTDPVMREIFINELKTNGKTKNKEVEFIKKSGEKFFALGSAEVIMIGDKQFILAAYTDISNRKKAEQMIEQKNSELEKMNKELESFAYISSHDLQEPLRKIQMLSDRILEKEENNLSETGKDHFKRMQNAANRMQILIQDLLAYSRTNITERTFETTDLNEIIDDIKEDLKEELKEKNAIIETNQLCVADIIPFQFRQLLHNLISNSLKFSNPVNPPHIHITGEIANGRHLNNEKLFPQNKYCHITVSDNGIGFEPQHNEKIFEVFKRLHVREHYHGTGIGLSIVKKIVENHNGIITAQGELNKGATFEIYFPTT
jgi:PAS domain S-box-containing protein